MASRLISAEQMLAAIPSLPRPMLTRLVDHMIDRLDELEGDADVGENGDREAVDEREPEEEFRLVAGSPTLRRYCVDTASIVAIPVRWRLSISTRSALLEMMRDAG